MTGCDVFFDAIGDLDYDGTSYRANWPDSTRAGTIPHAVPARAADHTGRSQVFPDPVRHRHQRDRVQHGLRPADRVRLRHAPKGPGHFYPYFTQANVNGDCVWEFGNMRNGNDFGAEAQYGTVRPGTLGAFVGPIMQNPQC